MLKGGGALNPDGLALDLAFALDRSFATDPAAPGAALITSRRGPAAKFSRGSGATQVNAAGLIEYAPENLLIRSNSLNNWAANQLDVSSASEATPTGGFDAWKITEDTSLAVHNVTQGATPVTGAVHTVSIWLKSAENGFAFFGVNGGGFPTTFISVDLASGAVTTGVGSPVNAASTAFTNGWFRVSFSLTATSSLSTAVDLRLTRDGIWANRSYLGNGINGIYAYGAQLERASTARAYNPTTSAVFYGPRFDHDPATGVCKGLLIEESRENFALHSQSFANSYWSTFATATATDDITTSPSGVANSASRITATSGTDTSRLRVRLFSLTAGSSQRTVSVLLKAGTHGFGILSMAFNKVGVGTVRSSQVIVNLSTGSAVQTGTLTGFSFSVTQHPDGWWRIAISATSNASIAVEDQVVMAFGMSYNGAGGSGFFTGTETVFGWGGQLEAGAFPLSYIPTTSGTAARSADVCSIISTDFSSFYNQSEGTLFGDVTPQTVSQASAVLYVGDGGTQFQNGIYKSNSLLTAAGLRWGVTTVSTGFSTQASIVTATDVATSRSKLAYGFKLDDFGFAYEGTLVGTDSSGTLPATNPSQMGIGNRNGSIQINGHIARIQYFRKRLSNAKLQTLTAP